MIIEATSPQRLVRILDFGIARLTERTQLTQQGLAIGTVSYMAPEQIEGADVDGRADLWALGVVLYRMLAGSLPFERESTRDEVAAILGAEPSPIQAKQHDLPSELEEVVRRALAKDPEKRYQSAVEMLADLEMLWSSVRSEAPERRLPLASHGETAGGQRRLWRLGALAALLVFAALAVWRFGPAGEPERRCRSPEKIDADRRPPHS
jgi:serine/threonine-protein kinase